jgi:hypothetical protein
VTRFLPIGAIGLILLAAIACGSSDSLMTPTPGAVVRHGAPNPVVYPTTPRTPSATEIDLFRSGLPDTTRSAFDAAYADSGYDADEMAMARLLYTMATRTFFVDDSEKPNEADARFLIDHFPAGLTNNDYTYLTTLLGVDTGTPVLRSTQSVTSVIGSPVYHCFRDARIFSVFWFLSQGEASSYDKCIHDGPMIALGGPDVASKSLNNADVFAERILNCLSRTLPPMPSFMLVLFPESTGVTDLVEFQQLANKRAADGLVMSDHRGVAAYGVAAVGEENVADTSEILDSEGSKVGSIVVHEIAHLLMDSNQSIKDKVNAAYRNAIASGLWPNTYQALNANEYFAVLTTIIFGLGYDSPSTDAAGLDISAINGPEALRAYDAQAYELLSSLYPCTAP